MERTGNEDDTNGGKTFDGSVDGQHSDSSSTANSSETVIEVGSSEVGSSEVGSSATPKQSSVVTARGTAEGLIIRLDGRTQCDALRGAINDFLIDRKAFVAGQSVGLEWIGAEPEQTTLALITADLRTNYNIKVKSSEVRMVAVGRPTGSVKATEISEGDFRGRSHGLGQSDVNPPKRGLFGGIDAFDLDEDQSTQKRSQLRSRVSNSSPQNSRDSSSRDSATDARRRSDGRSDGSAPTTLNQPRNYDPTLWDDADTRQVCKTLRSGQKIETEHSLLVIGDVNSGAELVAGGDIIVLGALRGVAHAGAFDETGGGRFIFAVDLEPTQLRIGAIISRGAQSDSSFRAGNGDGPEIARVDGNIITVEPYSARTVTNLRR